MWKKRQNLQSVSKPSPFLSFIQVSLWGPWRQGRSWWWLPGTCGLQSRPLAPASFTLCREISHVSLHTDSRGGACVHVLVQDPSSACGVSSCHVSDAYEQEHVLGSHRVCPGFLKRSDCASVGSPSVPGGLPCGLLVARLGCTAVRGGLVQKPRAAAGQEGKWGSIMWCGCHMEGDWCAFGVRKAGAGSLWGESDQSWQGGGGGLLTLVRWTW